MILTLFIKFADENPLYELEKKYNEKKNINYKM